LSEHIKPQALALFMPIRTDRSDPKLQKACETFGKAYLRWRDLNELAQQDIHEWAQIVKIPLHNSQIAYLEGGRLDPKSQFWISLEKLNSAIADQKIPGAKDKFNKTRRDRLKKAEPFYCADGSIATATDFFSQFIGQQEINKKYTAPAQSAGETLKEYSMTLEKEFKQVAKENMYSTKECWEMLCDTKPMKKVKEPKLRSLAQDILRGEHILLLKEAALVKATYKECPVLAGLRELADHPLSKKVEDAHKRVLLLSK